MNQEVIAYRKHMNLKLAADELGVAWQSLYVRLKKFGEPIIGDKLKYGSDRDRLGALAEKKFNDLVPFAINGNKTSFQSKYDFEVFGHKVDVKASKPHRLNAKYESLFWTFSFKKQTLICDFICCFCLNESSETENILLVPSEFFKGLQTVSVSRNGCSKWLDYSVKAEDLAVFFAELHSI